MPTVLGRVVRACNAWELERGESGVQGQLQLIEFMLSKSSKGS